MIKKEPSEQNNEIKLIEGNHPGRLMLGSGLAVLLAIAAFFSGLQIGSFADQEDLQTASLFSLFYSPKVITEEADLKEFWKVWNLLDEKFAMSSSSEAITTEEKINGAIKGLVRTYGDPYTVYLPADDAAMFEDDISGNFSGVGMEVGMREGLITVISPLQNTPADKAGVKSGDKIVKIDGQSTENMSIDQAVRLIRGEANTTVTLTLYRKSEPDFIEIPVVRANINIPTVDTEIKGDVFIISLYSFNAVAEEKMQEAMQEYIDSGLTKLVLDLRGNPGGFLQSAVSIASYFLPAGKVVVQEGFGDGSEDKLYRSSSRSLGKNIPKEMVILIDGGSASASEILAGALREHGVATLMGDTTFGKGSVQELIALPSKASLKVTIARWFTPEGKSISEGGLNPDIFVKQEEKDTNANIDSQLEAAIEWLRGNKNVGATTKTSLLTDFAN